MTKKRTKKSLEADLSISIKPMSDRARLPPPRRREERKGVAW